MPSCPTVRRPRRSAVPDGLTGRVAHRVVVTDVAAERLQPAVEDSIVRLEVADSEPDAGKPVRNEYEHDEQQCQHSGAVLNIQVEFTGNSSQTQ